MDREKECERERESKREEIIILFSDRPAKKICSWCFVCRIAIPSTTSERSNVAILSRSHFVFLFSMPMALYLSIMPLHTILSAQTTTDALKTFPFTSLCGKIFHCIQQRKEKKTKKKKKTIQIKHWKIVSMTTTRFVMV